MSEAFWVFAHTTGGSWKGLLILQNLCMFSPSKMWYFVWSDECQEAFQNLKAALTSPPILAYPSESDAFILDNDASSVGIGAVLSQVQNGTERVIAYFSRVLNPAERNYCVTRRELLAVVCAVNHFHHYLCGRHFLVRSDHGSLRWLMNFRNLEGQMGRWLAFLNNYDFAIQHRPGKSHGNADALSRRSCTVCDFCERREQQELAVLAWDGDDQHFCGLLVADNPDVSQQWFESYSPTQLRQWQDDDPVLHKVLQWVESGSKPSWQDIQSEVSFLRQYWSSFAHLELKDGVLYRRCDDALKRPWRTISRGFVSTLSLLLRDRNGILMTGQNYISSGRVIGSFGFTHQISETNWKVCTLGHTWWLVSLERWLILFSGTPPIDQSQSMLTTSRDIIVRISLNRGWARQPGINQVGHQVLQDKGIAAMLSQIHSWINMFHCVEVPDAASCQADLPILTCFSWPPSKFVHLLPFLIIVYSSSNVFFFSYRWLCTHARIVKLPSLGLTC